MLITSVNALIEALRDGQPLNKVLLSSARRDRGTELIRRLCHERGITVQVVPPEALTRRAGGRHQGVLAETAPVNFVSLEEMMAARRPGQGLLLILDGVEDSGNLGAIVRTAAAAGVDGILLPERRSAPVSDAVWTASAGTLGKVRIGHSRNLANDVRQLKQNGFWVAATAAGSTLPYHRFDFRTDLALIFGNEHRGVSPLLRRDADERLSIPIAPGVESLNVAAAVAVVLFEALRQRTPGGADSGIMKT
jgi:23S rRNA (guanosine2251-2'-O)-methyltransferase